MIRSTFASFELAKSALNVAQHGLSVTGNNVSNVDTKGYTRQRADQISVGAGTKSRYAVYGKGGTTVGMGAQVTGVSQIRDKFLDRRYRSEVSSYGEYAVLSNGLEELNSILDEIRTEFGLNSTLEELLTNLTTLATKPSEASNYATVRNSAQKMMSILSNMYDSLDSIQTQTFSELQMTLNDQVNSMIERIAYLNTKIYEENVYGNPANEMLDERNLLLDQLSEYLDINVLYGYNTLPDGRTIETVRVTLNSRGEEFDLIDRGNYHNLNAVLDDDGMVKIQLMYGDAKDGIVALDDFTGYINGGALNGYLQLLNGYGAYADLNNNALDDSYRGINYYMNLLDDFSNTFAQTMNELNAITVKEVDSTGALTGNEYTIYKDLFVTSDGSDRFTASNLRLSDEWIDDARYLTAKGYDIYVEEASGTNPGTFWIYDAKLEDYVATDYSELNPGVWAGASNPANPPVGGFGNTDYILQMGTDGKLYQVFFNTTSGQFDGNSTTHPNKAVDFTNTTGDTYTFTELEALENAAIVSGGDSDATNINRIYDALKKGDHSFNGIKNGSSNPPVEVPLYTGTFSDFLSAFLLADLASDTSLNTTMLNTKYSTIEAIADNRDAVSGVNTEEEAINMLTYQNYYNAAARYLTALDEALNTLINGTGIVGRS